MTNRPSRRLAKASTYLFRIHFKDGATQDVRAETAATARECARPGEIAKVKIIRETQS